MHSSSAKAFVTTLLLGVANAHFFITYPPPIPGSNPKQPLEASGADFPCHGATLTEGTVTNINVGSTVPLEFGLGAGANTAVHGGGSCQISLTYETSADALKNPSSWYVIQSYVGGCPTDFTGNLNSAVMCPGSYPNCVNNLNFTVPPEVQNGNAILAWTWFNNVGNREMYMNCARVSVSGGQNQLSQLPNMLAANIGNGCASTESFNIDFPNPGKYVQKQATLNFPTKLPTGSGCPTGPGSANVSPLALIGGPNQVIPANLPPPDTNGGANPPDGAVAGGAAGGAGGAASGAATPATSSANNGQYTQSAAAPASPAATSQATSGGLGGPISGASSPAHKAPTSLAASAGSATASPAAAPLPTTMATSVTSVAPSAGAGAGAGAGTGAGTASAAPPAGTGATSGNCATGQVACTAEGFYCIDSNTYGECAFGCATPMQMAAGTQCMNNAVSDAVSYPGPPAGLRTRRRQVRRRA